MNKFQVSPDLPPSARSNITGKCTVQCTVYSARCVQCRPVQYGSFVYGGSELSYGLEAGSDGTTLAATNFMSE